MTKKKIRVKPANEVWFDSRPNAPVYELQAREQGYTFCGETRKIDNIKQAYRILWENELMSGMEAFSINQRIAKKLRKEMRLKI